MIESSNKFGDLLNCFFLFLIMQPMPRLLHNDYIVAAYMWKHILVEFNVVFNLKLERSLAYEHQNRPIIVFPILLKSVKVFSTVPDGIQVDFPCCLFL